MILAWNQFNTLFTLVVIVVVLACAYHAAWGVSTGEFGEEGSSELFYLRKRGATPLNPIWWFVYFLLALGGMAVGFTLFTMAAQLLGFWGSPVCSPGPRIMATIIRWTNGERAANEYRRRWLADTEKILESRGWSNLDLLQDVRDG